MKIKCKYIYNEKTKEYEDFHPRMTIGKLYRVLEVEFYLNKVLYRIIGDSDKVPILQNASQFEIISGDIPANWEMSQLKTSGYILGPKNWQSEGFWEDYFDGDPSALEIYKREVQIIMEQES